MTHAYNYLVGRSAWGWAAGALLAAGCSAGNAGDSGTTADVAGDLGATGDGSSMAANGDQGTDTSNADTTTVPTSVADSTGTAPGSADATTNGAADGDLMSGGPNDGTTGDMMSEMPTDGTTDMSTTDSTGDPQTDGTAGDPPASDGDTAGTTGDGTTIDVGFVGVAACDNGPLDLPLPNCAPESPPSTGDFQQDCVNRINQFRHECQCLPPLERWVEGEDCANQHAQYDYEVGSAHAGVRDGICQPAGAQNECGDYAPRFDIIDFCLQQMWDEGPGEDFQVHGHYINMSDPNAVRVACGRYETPEGNIWSVQNFSRR